MIMLRVGEFLKITVDNGSIVFHMERQIALGTFVIRKIWGPVEILKFEDYWQKDLALASLIFWLQFEVDRVIMDSL